jgi:hypothetical protein
MPADGQTDTVVESILPCGYSVVRSGQGRVTVAVEGENGKLLAERRGARRLHQAGVSELTDGVAVQRTPFGRRSPANSASRSAGSRTRAIISFTGDSTLKELPVNTAIRSSDGTRNTF